MKKVALPSLIRLDASTCCQLGCPCCPQNIGVLGARASLSCVNSVEAQADSLNPWEHHAKLVTEKPMGKGTLKFSHFKEFIVRHPFIRRVELSNYGEIFLNPELLEIIEFAARMNVELSAENGVNLNNANDRVLDALVRYKFKILACAIDGATNETYRTYRVGGNLAAVLGNIERINHYKNHYRSPYPVLTWLYIMFGHNEREIPIAREMARKLRMNFLLRLNVSDQYSPIRDRIAISQYVAGGFQSRKELYEQERLLNRQKMTCVQLWNSPQINWDGRMFGCCLNFWGDFGNVFEDGLMNVFNSDKISRARASLMGEDSIASKTPCSECLYYETMRQSGNFITHRDIYYYRIMQRVKYQWMLLAKERALPDGVWN